MKRHPDQVDDDKFQRCLDGKTLRIEGKAVEQRGVHRIGLGVDELQRDPGGEAWRRGADEGNRRARQRDAKRQISEIGGGCEQQHGAHHRLGQDHRRKAGNHGKADKVGAGTEAGDIKQPLAPAEGGPDTGRRQHARTRRDDQQKHRRSEGQHRLSAPARRDNRHPSEKHVVTMVLPDLLLARGILISATE